MSLLTRCPACETLFKLVPDQLRISQGWVKCGKCAEIFDASQHLIEVALEAPHPPVVQAENVSEAEVRQPDSTSGADPTESVGETDDQRIAEQAAPEDALFKPDIALVDDSADAAPASDGVAEPASLAKSDAMVQPATDEENVADAVSALETASTVEVTLAGDVAPAVDAPAADAPALDAAPQLDASFLRSGSAAHAQNSSVAKWALGLSGLLLGVTLLSQWLYWDRDRLAASHDGLATMLKAICQPLGCRIQALKRTDAIVVDSVTFTKTEAGLYRLNFVIRNTADLPVALPDVELSLTDVSDQVVIRRVLKRSDLMPQSNQLGAAQEQHLIALVQIGSQDLAARILGYRLVAFYAD